MEKAAYEIEYGRVGAEMGIRVRGGVEAVPGGTRVRDRLRVEPRLAPEALTRGIVSALFRWRHRRLRARFGQLESHS